MSRKVIYHINPSVLSTSFGKMFSVCLLLFFLFCFFLFLFLFFFVVLFLFFCFFFVFFFFFFLLFSFLLGDLLWIKIICSCQKPFVFSCFYALFSNIYHRIKLTAKIWPDLCNFYGKLDFWIIFLENIFEFSSLILNYLCSIKRMWKFLKFWISRTYWKPASKLPTLLFFFIILFFFFFFFFPNFAAIFFSWEK